MIIYIAGPITGVYDYRERFKQVEEELKAKGHIVLNPAILPPGLTYEAYMRICKAMILEADAAYFLDGWLTSKGAQEECAYAKSVDKKLYYQVADVLRRKKNQKGGRSGGHRNGISRLLSRTCI